MALPARSLTPAPPDPILGLAESFKADTRQNKVNLSVGVYVDDSGVTPVIPSVLEAERRLLAKAGSKGYLPIDGRPAYKAAIRDLVFGPDHEIVASGRSATAETPGGATRSSDSVNSSAGRFVPSNGGAKARRCNCWVIASITALEYPAESTRTPRPPGAL